MIPWSQILSEARTGLLKPIVCGDICFYLDEKQPGDLMMTVRVGQDAKARFHRTIATIESPTHLKLLVEGALERQRRAKEP